MDSDRLTIISSDGHAGAKMADYRGYLDPGFRDEFDEFLADWNRVGSRAFDLRNLENRLDPVFVQEWAAKMVDTGRIEGYGDPARRLIEVEHEGICAEVLFPDFGIPFELYPPTLASALGYPPLDWEHRRAGTRAFNRWLGDYVSSSPDRFVGMATVTWDDVEETVRDIREAKEVGLKGVVLPKFSPTRPLFHPDFDPVWSAIASLDLIVNSHGGMSATTDVNPIAHGAPHPACGFRLVLPEHVFYCRNVLSHLIWGGILERYPDTRFVFTEQGSGWIPAELLDMDYSYEGSYYRSDYKSVIKCKPSEYFRRQCFIGASIFSQAEVAARNVIGLEQMMLGMDFPHHEGTLIETTQEYLRATLGASGVSESEARRLLGETAATVFGFDMNRLAAVAARVGPRPEDVLSEPDTELFPRGDVHRPMLLSTTAVGSSR